MPIFLPNQISKVSVYSLLVWWWTGQGWKMLWIRCWSNMVTLNWCTCSIVGPKVGYCLLLGWMIVISKEKLSILCCCSWMLYLVLFPYNFFLRLVISSPQNTEQEQKYTSFCIKYISFTSSLDFLSFPKSGSSLLHSLLTGVQAEHSKGYGCKILQFPVRVCFTWLCYI